MIILHCICLYDQPNTANYSCNSRATSNQVLDEKKITIPYKDIDNVSIIRSKYSISSSWFESGLQKRSWMKCLKKIENYWLNPRIGGRIMTIMWKFALLASIKDPQVSYSFARGPKLQQWWLSDAWTIFVGLSPT